jgi:hypothetical protein
MTGSSVLFRDVAVGEYARNLDEASSLKIGQELKLHEANNRLQLSDWVWLVYHSVLFFNLAIFVQK